MPVAKEGGHERTTMSDSGRKPKMKKHLLAAVAALAIGGAAHAGTDDEYACMHYGPTSSACQYYRQQQETENRLRALENQQRNQPYGGSYRMNCALYGRC